MDFEWDEAKRLGNIEKHGVDFLRAQLLFDGRPVITAPSLRRSEARYATTGKIGGRFYTVIWTWRGEAIRLISVRRARDEEEARHRTLFGEGN
jgi:uncharacterized protein